MRRVVLAVCLAAAAIVFPSPALGAPEPIAPDEDPAPRGAPRSAWHPLISPMLVGGLEARSERLFWGVRLEFGAAHPRGLGVTAYGTYAALPESGLGGGGLSLHLWSNDGYVADELRPVLALSVGGFAELRAGPASARGVSASVFAGARSSTEYSSGAGLRAEVRASVPTGRAEFVVTFELEPIVTVVLLAKWIAESQLR